MTNAFEPKTDRELLIVINDHVSQLQDDVKEIKEKMNETPDMDYCDKQHNQITKSLDNYSGRIRSLENWKWYIVGGLGIIYFIVIIYTSVIKKL
jgi:hypothetical protein